MHSEMVPLLIMISRAAIRPPWVLGTSRWEMTARKVLETKPDDPAANLVGIASSASQGAITAAQLDARPLMRPGEMLETVPGLIVSQHSGEGKANQYYARGFNLDHGTDFSTTVAGARELVVELLLPVLWRT